MTIESEFAGLTTHNAEAVSRDAAFYLEFYDIAVHRIIAARGHDEILGHNPPVCRFCARTEPEVRFRKKAHVVPELAGNGTLISLYECDECNSRFSAFEDDLGKLTLLERVAGQVLGKVGVPSVKSRQKKSRIDMGAGGLDIQEHLGDPIADVDHEKKTLSIRIEPQAYRPLGVYKALVKIALTLMSTEDLEKLPEALRWLKAADLSTDQIDDGTRYSCFRSWTPGPAPFAQTRAILLRRKLPDALSPAFFFLLGFGNISFQIALPAPREDQHLIGKSINLRPVPIFDFLEPERVRGPTKIWVQNLSSREPEKGTPTVVFHFDRLTRHPNTNDEK